MSTRWESYPLKFEGGWRTDLGRLDHGMNAPGSATTLKNFEPSITGGYSRISGYSKFSTTEVGAETGNVTGVISVDEVTVLARRGKKYYTSSGTSWTEKLEVTNTGGTRISFAVYKFDTSEKIVIVDGVEDPVFYTVTGGTMSIDTNAPAEVTGARIVREFKNQLWFAKNNILTCTSPWTDNDYDTGNGSFQIAVSHNITGLIPFRDQLIVFTTDSIHRISGDTSENFVMSPITARTGCLCPYSVEEVGGDVMYLGPDGIRWLSATERNNDFGLERASHKIQDKALSIINSNCGYTALVVRSKNQYRLFTYISSTPRELSEGLLGVKFSDQGATDISWARVVGMKVYSGHSRQYRDREVIVFSSEDGYVYQMENGSSFDGAPINAVFETPYMPINDPRIRKTFYKHTLYLKTRGLFSFDVNLRLDYNPSGSIQPPTFSFGSNTGTAIWGTSIWGQFKYSRAVSDTFINQVVGSGFTVALRYEDTSTNPPFTLDYVILEFGTNERR